MNPPANARGRVRLAVVLSHPTQYYSPWFRWLARHTALGLRVFYLWDFGAQARRDPQFLTTFSWDVDLLSGYEHEFVPNAARHPGTHHFWGLRNPTLLRRLNDWNPDAVLLFGYKWAASLAVIGWARRRGKPLLFRGDSHLLGRAQPAGIRALLLRAVYAQMSAFLAVGRANTRYFEALRVPARRIFFAPHSVDAERFDPSRPEVRRAASELRATLGLTPETRVAVFAGKFSPAKQPLALLRAFLAVDAPGAALVFVGDGHEKAALQAAAEANGRAQVRFLPFANQSEMPARYLLGDLFVLPSRGSYETWGLAVNEAMHMGVPCLVSDRVGCQEDLVTPLETGWVFAAEQPGALEETLRSALTASAADLARLAANARRRVAGYTYAQTTRGLEEALAAALPSR